MFIYEHKSVNRSTASSTVILWQSAFVPQFRTKHEGRINARVHLPLIGQHIRFIDLKSEPFCPIALNSNQSVLKVFYTRFHTELVKFVSLIHYYNSSFIRWRLLLLKVLVSPSLSLYLFLYPSYVPSTHNVRFPSFVL